MENIQVHLAHQVFSTHHFEYRYVNANDVDKEFYYKQTKKQSFILEFVYTSNLDCLILDTAKFIYLHSRIKTLFQSK